MSKTTATTNYGSLITKLGWPTGLHQHVLDFLGDEAAEFDVDGIETTYRNAIDEVLPDGVELVGDELFGPDEAEINWGTVALNVKAIDLLALLGKVNYNIYDRINHLRWQAVPEVACPLTAEDWIYDPVFDGACLGDPSIDGTVTIAAENDAVTVFVGGLPVAEETVPGASALRRTVEDDLKTGELSGLVALMRRSGDRAPVTSAREWRAADFNTERARAWLEAGCFQAEAATELAALGVTPTQAALRLPLVQLDGRAERIGYAVADRTIAATEAANIVAGR